MCRFFSVALTLPSPLLRHVSVISLSLVGSPFFFPQNKPEAALPSTETTNILGVYINGTYKIYVYIYISSIV